MRLLSVIIFAWLLTPAAQAQVLDEVLGSVTDSISDITDELLLDITNIRLGLGPVVSPDYEGSGDYHVSPAPLISFHYRDILQIDNNHIRVNVFGGKSMVHVNKFSAGPSLSLDFGRHESDNPDLTGLGNIGTSVEAGMFASYREGPTRVRVRVRKDLASGHSGLIVTGDFRVLFYKTEKVAVITTISGSWVDNNYMDAFFSITPEQSLASGLPEFDAEPDFKDVSFDIATNYQFSKNWSFIANAGYKRLTGDARHSPLVRLRGSANQLVGGVYAVYSF